MGAEMCIRDSGSSDMRRRDDDNEATVVSRLEAYHAQTAPLAEWYQCRDLFVAVNGDQEIHLVSDEISSILESL